MKSNTHPTWHNAAVVTCSCGNTFTTGSTLPTIHVDICSQCHPFFTGEMKFVDVQGRVEKFQAKMKQSEGFRSSKKSKKTKETRSNQPAKSLKEMLTEVKKTTITPPEPQPTKH